MGSAALRGGFLPPAILCAALGIALAFIPLRRALSAAVLLVLVAMLTRSVEPPQRWIEPIFVGCWLSVIANTLLVHRPERVPSSLFFVAAINAGAWAGAVTAVSGARRDLAIALPLVLLFVPGREIINRGWSIGLKVVASWLAAVAILATMVSLTPTPGYKPDHME